MRVWSFYKILFCAFPLTLSALPQGGEVRAGKADFVKTDPKALVVKVSDKTILKFDSFDIAKEESVHFVQPKRSSTLLARIDSGKPSSILGKLNSSGRLFLINPEGVYFGPDAVVNTGSLIASTLEIRDQDFLSDTFQFFLKPDKRSAKIFNEGVLTASEDGSVVLLAPQIENEGTILAPTGQVLLASAEKVLLDFVGDGLIRFSVEGELKEALLHGVNPVKALDGLVNREGIVIGSQLVEEEGVIRLVASSRIEGKEVAIKAANVEVAGSLITTQDLSIEAEKILCLRDAPEASLFTFSYRDYYLRGKRIDIFVLDHPSSRIQSLGNMTFVSENPIFGDGHFYAGHHFRVLKPDGRAADLLSRSDPIINASTGSVQFGAYSGPSLKVISAGNIECQGDINITMPDVNACNGVCSSDPDCTTLENFPSLILLAGATDFETSCNPVPPDQPFGGTTFTSELPATGNLIIFGTGAVGETLTISSSMNGGIYTGVFTGHVQLNADVTFQGNYYMLELDSNIEFNGNIDSVSGTAHNLSFQGPTVFTIHGSIGSQNPVGDIDFGGLELSVDGGIHGATFTATNMVTIPIISIFGPLITTAAGGVEIGAGSNFPALLLHNVTASGGDVALKANSLALFGDITAQNNVEIIVKNPNNIELRGLSSTFTSNTGEIFIQATNLVDNGILPTDLTLNAPGSGMMSGILLETLVDLEGSLNIYSTKGTAASGNSIEADKGITITGPLTLLGDTTFLSNGGDIGLDSITGSSFNVQVTAGAGDVTLNGNLDLGSFTVSSSGSSIVTFNDAMITTDGNFSIESGNSILFNSNLTVLSNTGGISFTGASLDSPSNGLLTLTAPMGDVTIGPAVGNNNLPLGFNITGETVTFPSIQVGSSGVIVNAVSLLLNNNVIASNGPINFQAPVITGSAASGILLNANGGTVTLADDVNVNTPSQFFQIDGTGPIDLFGNITTNGGDIITHAPLNIMGASLTLMSNGGNITLNQVSGENLTLDAGTGIVTLQETVDLLASLTVDATTTQLAANTTVTGDILFNSDISRNSVSNVTVNSTTGNITVNGTISSDQMGTRNLTLEASTGSVNLNQNISSAPLSSLSVNAATINLPGTLYYADAQVYQGGALQLTAGMFTELRSTAGGIQVSTGSFTLSSGTHLLINTQGGDFSYLALAGAVAENMTVFTKGGTVTFGTTTNIGTLAAFVGPVFFNGPITLAQAIFQSAGSILNSAGSPLITASGDLNFNALGGGVGTTGSPIQVAAGDTVTAGAAHLLADFNGMTVDGTVHSNPLNPPCPLIFNGVVIQPPCPPPSPPPSPPSPIPFIDQVPPRTFFVVGIYSQYDSLVSDYYFLPEVVDRSYVRLGRNLLYLNREQK
jgi:filamentous hemagglutinin family protein